jgi:uncharacterized membrane protein
MMAPKKCVKQWTNEQVDTLLGNTLRTGVILSAVVVSLGALLYLIRHGLEVPDYRFFKGEPANLRSIVGVIQDSFSFSGRGIIQLGILLLIATPVMRVVLSLVAFIMQRDRTYIAITLVVLFVLIYSLAGI